MKHLLIGTAGHVDHGKTSLIKALTGIDADRLAEEKKRGITIELGFARMELPDGRSASVIDVPGHEKFVKNMLAGAGGIDLALLVVAADDGVMPQTREHLDILEMLGTACGIVVVTKTDLVDEEWLALVSEDIRELAAPTFLGGAEPAYVSSHTGDGVAQLKSLIAEKIKGAPAKNLDAPFRLPVDRVFTMDGFGTVVTGTLVEGQIRPGDAAEILPGGIKTKLRGVQVHGLDAGAAYAGQRVALNLAGTRRDEVKRGDTIARPGSVQPTRMADVKLSMLKGAKREIRSGQRLHFHYGTGSALCKAALIDSASLSAGCEGFAQLRFLEDVALKRGDPFVLRFYSPTETVGGGTVLDEKPLKFRRAKAAEAAESMRGLESGDALARLLRELEKTGLTTCGEIAARLGTDPAGLGAFAGDVVLIGDGGIMSKSHSQKLLANLTGHLEAFHEKNPLLPGMAKQELRARAAASVKPADFDELLLAFDDELRAERGCVRLAGFKPEYGPAALEMKQRIAHALAEGGFSPPPAGEIVAGAAKAAGGGKAKAEKLAAQVLDAMLFEGEAVLAEPGMAFSAGSVALAKEKFAALAEKSPVSLGDFRDALGTSRKFALSMLEYFDRSGFSAKRGENRELMANPL